MDYNRAEKHKLDAEKIKKVDDTALVDVAKDFSFYWDMSWFNYRKYYHLYIYPSKCKVTTGTKGD